MSVQHLPKVCPKCGSDMELEHYELSMRITNLNMNLNKKTRDKALAFVPRERLPEGKVLTKEELLKIPPDIFFIQRTG